MQKNVFPIPPSCCLLLFFISLMVSCQKALQQKEIAKELTAQTLTTNRLPPVSTCGSSVSGEVSKYRNGIDTAALRKNAGVIYWIPFDATRGGVKIYNIPFADNTPARPHFLLVATDELETTFKGNEITVILNTDFQSTGIFNGEIRCKPITNSLVERYSFSQSKRTTYLPAGKAVVPLQPAPVVITLPEVIVVGHYPPSGGITWGLWLNLLDLVGIIPGFGNIGGGLGGGGGAGGSYGSGYYGPVIGPGNPYPPGGGVVTPPSADCPMPIVLPTFTNESVADFSNPASPVNVSDESLVVEPHATIEDIPSNDPPNNPRIIAHTINRGNTEDMEYGTDGNTDGITPWILHESDNNLFARMSTMFGMFTVSNATLKPVAELMIQRFRNRTGGSYENETLNNNVRVSGVFNDFVKRFSKDLNTALKSSGYNFNNVANFELGYRPKFDGLYHKFHGLQILINDTEYTEIQLDNTYVWPDGMWQADVTITIHDHFGLDKPDAITYQGYELGFAAWWTLQHTRNYRPFETLVKVQKRITWRP